MPWEFSLLSRTLQKKELGEFFSAQWTRTTLCRCLRGYFGEIETDTPFRVGTDVPFYYDPTDRLARVVPDVYAVKGVDPDEQIRSFRVFERGVRPFLVVHLIEEPISAEDGLMMHFSRLGVQDVVLYDPLWFLQSERNPQGRRLLWHFQRREEKLQLVPLKHPGRVPLSALGLTLLHRGGGELRVYVGATEESPKEDSRWLLPEERTGRGTE